MCLLIFSFEQSTCEVRVVVTDVNDHSPIFHSSNIFTGSIKEDSYNGTLLKVVGIFSQYSSTFKTAFGFHT